MHAIVSVLSLFLLFNLGLAWEETSSAAYIAKTAAEKNAIIAANVIEAKMTTESNFLKQHFGHGCIERRRRLNNPI